jgi:hypothetical protein
MEATAQARTAIRTVDDVMSMYQHGQTHERISCAQVRALAAIALAIDRLAAAVEGHGRGGGSHGNGQETA